MPQQDNLLDFGHVLTGYNQESHKWQPITVNGEGKLLFQQDPDTAQSLSDLSDSVSNMCDSVSEMIEKFDELSEEIRGSAVAPSEPLDNDDIADMVDEVYL